MADAFLSNNVAAPHHRKAIGALIAAVIVFGIVLAVYFLRPEVEVIPQQPDMAQLKNSILAQPNPPVTLSSQEAAVKQSQLSAPNPKVTLTPEQVRIKRESMEF